MTAKEFDDILSFLDTIIRVENNVDVGDEPNEKCCKNVSVLLKNGNLIRGVLMTNVLILFLLMIYQELVLIKL